MSNSLDFLDKKAEKMLDLLRNDEQASRYNSYIILLLVIFLSCFIYYYIKIGFTPLLGVSIFLLIGILIFSRMGLMSAIKDNRDNSNYASYESVDQSSYVRSKLNYIKSGLDIKYKRVHYTRWLYVIMIPLVYLLIKTIIYGTLTTASLIWTAVLAYLVAGLFWWFFFKSELDELEMSTEDIDSLMRKI